MRWNKKNRKAQATEAMLEHLENRSLLANSPFPLISDLTNPSNTVVRLQTNFGDIDFELFDSAAPITVANFLKYVRDGDFDKTYFHRYAKDQSNNPFVIQGGLSRLEAPTNTGAFADSIEIVPTDAAITNEFNQSNLIRTVAMARVGGQVNSATSQFFINLKNNSFLDTVDQGFTVFGRVANDASWNVVQSIITSVTVVNLGSPFNELPTTTGFDPDGDNPEEDQMVTIRDAEIIKPQGVAAFYTYRVYYPEGFAGSNINEFLPLGNPGSTTVRYQVIVRSEVRDPRPQTQDDFWYRDKVINTGTIGANRRGGITISTFGTPANNLVPRQGMPYGIEVWATGPIEAMISHYDFGSSTIEAFTRTTDTMWTLPDIRKGADINDFVVWANTSDQPATLTLKFFLEGGGTPIEITRTTEAFRRGGLAINNVTELANGNYSLQITSDQPIVAALTHYKTTGVDKGGSTETGITGMGGTRGVLALANNGGAASNIADTVSVLNPNGAGAVVTLIARFDDNSADFTITGAPLIIAPNSRASFTLPDADALRNKKFSIIYTSGSQRVFVSTSHVEHNDVSSSPFSYTAATRHDFAEGFMNGAPRAGTELFETLALFNPNASTIFGGTDETANVTVRFLFADGFVMAQDFVLDAGKNMFIDMHTYQPLLDQVANNRFFYSLEIVSDIGIIAQFSHYDTTLGIGQPSGGGLSIGTQRGTVTVLEDLINP